MAGFISPWRLKKLGVLGMNARNAEFVLRYNKRARYPNADSKLRSKALAARAGIPVPELYGVVGMTGEIKRWQKILGDRESFVIKPEHGSGGAGVLVLFRDGEKFVRAGGQVISDQFIRQHLADTIGGLYSLGWSTRPGGAGIPRKI